ncbi:MAG: glycosyltransferase family 2 protein [Candidatus Omnitrophica bacterium]|nr:glycosyltransferase family 2 protein [Candidatus Omnitrophota bacterium]
MKLSIIIPVYNEEKTLERLVEKILNMCLEGVKKEIIIVDDKSTDDTRNIIKEKFSSLNAIVSIFHAEQKGKGQAIKTALKICTGDLILIQDGDLEYDPEDYHKLIDCMIKNKAEVVYGSRLKNKKNKFKLIYLLANKFLTWLTNLLYASSLTDMETCYKLFKKDLLKNIVLKAKGFDFEAEVTARLLLKGINIYEVPINYNARGRKSGKKIGLNDGIIAILILLKHRVKKIFNGHIESNNYYHNIKR